MLGFVQGGSTLTRVHTLVWLSIELQAHGLSLELTSQVGTAYSLGGPPQYRKAIYPLLIHDCDALAQDPADRVLAARAVATEYALLPYNQALPPDAEAEPGCERRQHKMDGGMISASWPTFLVGSSD